MTTLEQLIETAKTLPPTDRRQLREWPREQERRDARHHWPRRRVQRRQSNNNSRDSAKR